MGHDMRGWHGCHHCDNPACVRPSHLFIGTATDNYRDSRAKGRSKKPPARKDWPQMVRAGKHHWQRLNLGQVQTIRARYDSGETQAALAREFNVSQQQVSKIVRRQRWAHS